MPQQYHLTTDGTYQFRVPRLNDATPLGTFTLDEKVIKDHAVRGAPGKPPQQYIGISTSKRFVNYLTMADTTGKRFEGTRYFVIYFPNVKTDPLGYEVRMVAPGTTSLTRKPGTGWLDYAEKVVVPSKKQLAGNLINRITFDVQADAPTQTITSRFLTYETTLEFESVTGFNVDSIQILVTSNCWKAGALRAS